MFTRLKVMFVCKFLDFGTVGSGFELAISWSKILILIILLKLLNIPRYLVVLYYQANKAFEKLNTQKKEDDLKKMKEKYDLKTPGRN